MSDQLTPTGSPFDRLRRVRPDGSEYWDARELMPEMEYGKWENFAAVIEKAKTSLALVEGIESAKHHFLPSGSDGGRWGNQRLDNYELTRFGAYLVAMAGDDTKRAVAEARIYFAVRAREAEIATVELDELVVAERYVAALKRNRELESAAIENAPLIAQAKAHRAGARDIARQDYAREVVKWAQKEHDIRLLQKNVFAFLDHLGLFIKPGRSDSGQATMDAIRRGLADTEKGTTEGGFNYATGKLTPTGQGYAWDRIERYVEANGSLELPRRIGPVAS